MILQLYITKNAQLRAFLKEDKEEIENLLSYIMPNFIKSFINLTFVEKFYIPTFKVRAV